MVDVERIRSVVAPVVEGLGMEVVRVHWGRQGRSRTLRIDLDRRRSGAPIPIPYRGSELTADELGEASHEISAVLDTYDEIRGSYVLEVSTPGLDRPIASPEDFRSFQGHEIEVVLLEPVDGRRKIRGTNLGLSGQDDQTTVLIEEAGQNREVALSRIRSANLVIGKDAIGSGSRKKPARAKRRKR